jgi:hypothetical protein
MTVAEGKSDVSSKPGGMRLLVAFASDYRAYGGAISSAIRVLRPHIQVESVGTDSLPGELARFAPQIVICSHPEGPDKGDRIAWIELPPESADVGHARLGDRRFEIQNPSLEKMLELIDEAQSLIRK